MINPKLLSEKRWFSLADSDLATLGRPSAVLVLFFPIQEQWHVLLTRRSRHLVHHPGQIALPGGCRDPEDRDLSETVLRELKEETGISLKHRQLLGCLPSLTTLTGFSILPFLACLDEKPAWMAEPGEVEEIFSVPVVPLFEQGFYMRAIQHPTGDFMSPVLNYPDGSIWGATARVLIELGQTMEWLPDQIDINVSES